MDTKSGTSTTAATTTTVIKRPPHRAAYNVYTRPVPRKTTPPNNSAMGVSTSPPTAGYSTIGVPESPRRGSIFSSFKLKRIKESSPRESPNGFLTVEEGVAVAGASLASDQAPSPRKGFFDQFNFRQRSKSDSRTKKSKSTARGGADGSATSSTSGGDEHSPRPPMLTILSVDEETFNSPPKTPERLLTVKPLYVDTKLANRGSTQQHQSLSARSPVAQIVSHFVSDKQRQRSQSTTTNPNVLIAPDKRKVSKNDNVSISLRNASDKRQQPHLLAQKSLDSSIDEKQQSPSPAIIFRDQSAFISGADAMQSLTLENEDLVYSQFMKAHKAYDLIPTSSKLVVFDTQLAVKKAFFALVYNGVRAAPLFDSAAQQFVGMLTITDFIDILQTYYKTGVSHIKELEEHKIATWREVQKNKVNTVVSIDPSESLYRAVQLLCDCKVHRLPVTDRATGNILYILTHKRMLRFLYLYIHDLPRPSFLSKTPMELNIGTFGSIQTVRQDTLLIEAFAKFLEHRVSALPVVDSDDRVVDVYAKFDVINLAADNTYNNLDITVQEALKHRSDWFEGVATSKVTDSLSNVIDTLVKAEVHRLIITDDEKRVCGVVSLSDIFKFLVLRPSTSDVIPV